MRGRAGLFQSLVVFGGEGSHIALPQPRTREEAHALRLYLKAREAGHDAPPEGEVLELEAGEEG